MQEGIKMAIRIRAHHLESLRATWKDTHGQLSERLVEFGYVEDASHEFPGKVLEFYQMLLADDNARMQPVIGETDAICDAPCPKIDYCPYVHPERTPMCMGVFGKEAESWKRDIDEGARLRLGLESREYSVREIKDILGIV
jgi:hypothetical protein